MPPYKDFSTSFDEGSIIRSVMFFREIGCHPSRPGDYPGFNSCIFSFPIVGVIIKVSKYSPNNC